MHSYMCIQKVTDLAMAHMNAHGAQRGVKSPVCMERARALVIVPLIAWGRRCVDGDLHEMARITTVQLNKQR